MKKYKVYIMEYERGWGSRVDEERYFDTQAKADAFITEYNKVNNLPQVPDWYMVAVAGY